MHDNGSGHNVFYNRLQSREREPQLSHDRIIKILLGLFSLYTAFLMAMMMFGKKERRWSGLAGV